MRNSNMILIRRTLLKIKDRLILESPEIADSIFALTELSGF